MRVKFSYFLFASLFMANVASRAFAVIGGQDVMPGELPAVVMTKMSFGLTHCTATLVGPRVLITASHCVDQNAEVVFGIRGRDDGLVYRGIAARSPSFKRGAFEFQDDVALVLVTESKKKDGKWEETEGVDGVAPMNIGFNIKEDDSVFLAGYGCTTKQQTGGNDGVLRSGKNSILLVKPTFSRLGKQGAWLCSGDSGGPVFVNGAVAAIASKTVAPMILDETKRPPVAEMPGVTYLSQLSTPGARKFLQDFAEEKKVDICGVSVECESPVLPWVEN